MDSRIGIHGLGLPERLVQALEEGGLHTVGDILGRREVGVAWVDLAPDLEVEEARAIKEAVEGLETPEPAPPVVAAVAEAEVEEREEAPAEGPVAEPAQPRSGWGSVPGLMAIAIALALCGLVTLAGLLIFQEKIGTAILAAAAQPAIVRATLTPVATAPVVYTFPAPVGEATVPVSAPAQGGGRLVDWPFKLGDSACLPPLAPESDPSWYPRGGVPYTGTQITVRVPAYSMAVDTRGTSRFVRSNGAPISVPGDPSLGAVWAIVNRSPEERMVTLDSVHERAGWEGWYVASLGYAVEEDLCTINSVLGDRVRAMWDPANGNCAVPGSPGCPRVKGIIVDATTAEAVVVGEYTRSAGYAAQAVPPAAEELTSNLCAYWGEEVAPAGTVCQVRAGEILFSASDIKVDGEEVPGFGAPHNPVRIEGPVTIACPYGCSFFPDP